MYKTTMHFQIPDMPWPTPMSLILVTITIGCRMLANVDPTHFSHWISVATGACALLSYGVRFIKWFHKEAKKSEKWQIRVKSGPKRRRREPRPSREDKVVK